jgi:hypothetical protein
MLYREIGGLTSVVRVDSVLSAPDPELEPVVIVAVLFCVNIVSYGYEI